ncbi:MAG: DUF3604 domain-containing protein, partial [Firmicutes bacterium]|nr:DUF3604 domain-containing protein [Bacillota bacterium]
KREMDTWYGRASISPDGEITAGSYGTWKITYTVGRYGIDNGGRLKVAMRLASDWGVPQTTDPAADNYFTVSTTGEAKIEARYDPRGHFRPWFKTMVLQVYDGSLKEGDRLVITYGDRSGGSRGARAQTFVEERFEFRVLVESFETGVFVHIPTSPVVRIVSGPPHRLLVLSPSQVTAGTPFSVTVKAEDPWGNPAHSYSGRVELTEVRNGERLGPEHTFRELDAGVRRIEGAVLNEPGLYQLRVRDAVNGFETLSNPIQVFSQAPAFHLFWGDIHGQTDKTVGTGSVEEYFRFARDAAALDFASHNGNDFQITGGHWREIQDKVKEFHVPRRFVTFLGYEWSGNHPAGGDHNVYYLDDDRPIYRSSHWQLEDKADAATDRYPITALYETLRGQRAMVIPHVGGRHANLEFHDPSLEPVIEISSVHGRFEWMIEEALKRGYKVGFVANSDDHTGRPGAAYATSSSFGVRGGLTAVYAHELTREAIWEALWARRCYATTGERILLSFQADGHLMGEEYVTARPPHFHVLAAGTAPLDRVEIRRGPRAIYSPPLHQPEDYDDNKLRIYWGGARIRGRGRHTIWDGQLTLDQGIIRSAKEFAFDNKRQGVYHQSGQLLRWRSTTSGDIDGLLIELEAPREAALTFSSAPATFSFCLLDLEQGELYQAAGGVGQFVAVARGWRTDSPQSTEFDFVDELPEPGLNVYYLRVMQADGEMAWSSPIFVNFRKGIS